MPPRFGFPNSSRSTKARRALHGRASPRCRCRWSPTVRSRPSTRRSRTSPARNFRTAPTWCGTRLCSMCCSSTRSTRIDRAFSIRPGLERLARDVVTVLRFLPPGGAVRAYEFAGDPGVVPLDPRWHQAALRFVESGLPPHPGWNRPSVVSALPGDSVPPLPPAARGGDRVHGGALVHADRVGVRPGARTRCGFRR